MALRITPVASLDQAWPTIEPLLAALHDYHYPLVGLELREDWAERQRRQWEAAPEGIVILAWIGADAIGLLNGSIERDRSIFVEEVASIDNMFVVKEHRHVRIGAALVEAFEHWAALRGVSTIRLGVVAANEAAREFWSAMGFEVATLRLTKRIEAPVPD